MAELIALIMEVDRKVSGFTETLDKVGKKMVIMIHEFTTDQTTIPSQFGNMKTEISDIQV